MIRRLTYNYDDRGCAASVFGCGTLGPSSMHGFDDVDAYASFGNRKGMRVRHVIHEMEQILAFTSGLADTQVPA